VSNDSISGRTQSIELSETGMSGFVALAVRAWVPIVLGLAIGALAGLAFGLMLPEQYESEATIIAANQIGSNSGMSNVGQLASAASSIGVNLGTGQSDPSFLFPWILRNRQVSKRILEAKYIDSHGDEIRLIDRIIGQDENLDQRIDRAHNVFHKKIIRFEQDRRSGISRVKVRLSDPVMASNVVNNCLAELDRYYQELKSQMAGGEYGFIASRLEVVEHELAEAENALLEFRQTNRNLVHSPALMLQEDRLLRDVDLNQQLYLTLHTQWEISGIEQQKNLPVFAILDHGYPATQPVAPKPFTMALLWGLLGGVIAMAFVVSRNAVLTVQDMHKV
jgi:uncharacterized protein involved in exopolysaccharide biosynthesis